MTRRRRCRRRARHASGAAGLSSARAHDRRRAARHRDGRDGRCRRHRLARSRLSFSARRVAARDDRGHDAGAARLSVRVHRAGDEHRGADHRAVSRAEGVETAQSRTAIRKRDIARAVGVLAPAAAQPTAASATGRRPIGRRRGSARMPGGPPRRARRGVAVERLRDRAARATISRASCTATRRVALTPVANWYRRARSARCATKWPRPIFSAAPGIADVAAENELAAQRGAARAGGSRASGRGAHATQAGDAGAHAHGADVGAGAASRDVVPCSPTPRAALLLRVAHAADGARCSPRRSPMDPANPLVGPLVETLVEQGRARRGAQLAGTRRTTRRRSRRSRRSSASQRRKRRARVTRARRRARASSRRRRTGSEPRLDVALTGLVTGAAGRADAQRLVERRRRRRRRSTTTSRVTEVPVAPPVTPDDRGMQVERWYESYDRRQAGDERGRGRSRARAAAHHGSVDAAVPRARRRAARRPRGGRLEPPHGVGAPGPGAHRSERRTTKSDEDARRPAPMQWDYGAWDSGWWSPFDHARSATIASSTRRPCSGRARTPRRYLARATTPGMFIRPPAHAEEMYNPGVNGRSDGGDVHRHAEDSRRRR